MTSGYCYLFLDGKMLIRRVEKMKYNSTCMNILNRYLKEKLGLGGIVIVHGHLNKTVLLFVLRF